MSWQVAAILFAIVAFEGVRRLDPDGLVLRCNPLGAWRVASPVQLWRQWHLVSVLPPFFLTIVVRREAGGKSVARDRDEVRSVIDGIEPILALRLLCALDFLLVVIGIPWGISQHGAAGLFALVACSFAVSAIIVTRLAVVRYTAGLSRWAAFRGSTSFLSPFAAPYAAESAVSSLLQQRAPIAVISGLLGEARFGDLVRPAAYDLESLQGGNDDSLLEEIARALSKSERAKILATAGDGCTDVERFCPRCAERYSVESTVCADCDGILLRAT